MNGWFKVNLNLIGKLFLDISVKNVYSEIVHLNNEIISLLERIAVEDRLSLRSLDFLLGKEDNVNDKTELNETHFTLNTGTVKEIIYQLIN